MSGDHVTRHNPLAGGFLLRLWRVCGFLLPPIAVGLALWRLARGQEEAQRLGERFGRAGAERPDGRLIWMHGASIGEVAALLPIANHMLKQDASLHVLMTSTTRASALILKRRMPPRCRHQYLPYDTPGAVRRFLKHWRPDLALWTDSEIWPHLILSTHAAGIPMAQVGAWMSERSHRRWRWAPRTAAALLNCFALCAPRDEGAARRLADLRGQPCDGILNLKEAGTELPYDGVALAGLRAQLEGRPCWLASNTHEGEEAMLARAHARLRRRHPRLLLLLAPRRPERAAALARALAKQMERISRGGADGEDFRLAEIQRRSEEPVLRSETSIYVIDGFGELGLFYRAVELAFLGGTLVDKGGHNPMEPARLECFVLHGKHTAAYDSMFADLDAAGGGMEVDNEEALVFVVSRMLENPRLRGEAAAAAEMFAASRGQGVVEEAARRLRALMAA